MPSRAAITAAMSDERPLSVKHDFPIRRRLVITGAVQGVGFRPFVYRLALERALSGFVLNSPEGVVVEVEGRVLAVEGFCRDLVEKTPPLARIVSLSREDIAAQPGESGESGFAIRASLAGAGHQVLVSPDTAVCADCLAELFDPNDRRHGYPFTNCTNCGPRYTITRRIPYDRAYTSMACFPLCPECGREYADPQNRRFHAQPNACRVCGPECWLVDRAGNELGRDAFALRGAAKALAQGRILAVKGLGGFHLACDATDTRAVEELRRRKKRPDKPLAVMVPDLEAARRLACLSESEAALLSGKERPIVLCLPGERGPLAFLVAPGVAPDTDRIGIMLPYAPLHHILFQFLRKEKAQGFPALVMTSGNAGGEPICLGNREALHRLSDIADLFVLHNRDILIRVDDSVLRLGGPERDTPHFFRRARGYTPTPIFLAGKGPCVLGAGPELKNTLCLSKDDQAFVSQHIGDMENLKTYGFYQEIAGHLAGILQVEPEAVVHDLHPEYLTTRFALEESGLPAYGLQHHFAHLFAVLAEHKHQGPALGLALDGTGYGGDKTLWGGECLYADTGALAMARVGRFAAMPLPGGETAIREPWRLAAGLIWTLERAGRLTPAARYPWQGPYAQAAQFLPQLLAKNLNCPSSTSCGRLFDAVAALIVPQLAISYEGQAAIVLERIQDRSETAAYACPLDASAHPAVLDTGALFLQAHADWTEKVTAGRISRRFHLGLIRGLAALAAHGARLMGVSVVGLSGGAMQNATLAEELPKALIAKGLVPLSHILVPPNDACISLGQVAYGRRLLTLTRGE